MTAAPALRFVDLGPAPGDADVLARFYRTLYVAEFPDPDERESLANMIGYLAHDGEYGNAYIVTLVYDGDALLGGSICDYFVRSNCGAIEFLTVAPQARGRGLGAALTEHVERRMADAATARGKSLAFVMAEMNDPFKRTSTPDNLDPFERLRFWDRLGYRRAAFPYVQPALSPEQSPVRNLLLAAKPFDPPRARDVETQHVVAFLSDYLIYAMRFDDPRTSPDFVAMSAYLAQRDTIPLAGLAEYIGQDPQRPLAVREIENTRDPDFGPATELYRRVSGDSALALDAAAFDAASDRAMNGGARYHLWALREQPDGPVCGTASFFALPSAGFGACVAFEPPLLRTGRLPLLIARIERALVGEGAATQGWYATCRDDTMTARLVAHGFTQVSLPYRLPPNGPPPDGSQADGPPAHLLYKEFGATYEPPHPDDASLRAALREIERVVYGIGAEP